MKRPGPLPSARPARPGRREAPSAPDLEQTGPVSVAADDGHDDGVVGGGVSGLTRISRGALPSREAQQARGAAADDEDDTGRYAQGRGSHDRTEDAPEDEPIGWRDLWRASRARRRALRAEARRFTVRTRRRRWYWIGSLGAVVLLIVGTLAAAYSPLFSVREVTVVGADTVDADAIVSALDDQIGTPMPLVDHSAIRAAMLEFPLIETYQVESHPPHELVVRLVERTPVGAIATDAGYTVVDAAGVALSTREGKPEGQPVIDVGGGTSSEAFAAVGQVLRSLPSSLRKQVTEVTASSPHDVTITLGASNASVVWGNASDSALKAVVLEDVMADRPADGVQEYDVSSPNAVVVR
ncbi:FtsQ-type POTRA domain-containing protein [Microbacterium sp. JB110]|uniref:FtsQ-type POTRA domain-containing protein n=1 Tax=Microbacterium sp. JB110 TaxID=2024477 RepID=UPI0020167685|nr:FtsQ-type POTRA domain-containing protein [Microbacterium sp. JB110]